MKHAKWISALILLSIPMIAAAQMSYGERTITQVPFNFTVGNVSIPAGEFTVKPADPNGAFLIMGNSDSEHWIYTLAIRDQGKTAQKSALVFKRYGDSYFLAELKVANSRDIYTFSPGKAEKELRAQNIHADEEILLGSK